MNDLDSGLRRAVLFVAIANLAIIAAGLVTAYAWRSAWPDLIVGFAIAYMNLDAAKEVWKADRDEHAAAV